MAETKKATTTIKTSSKARVGRLRFGDDREHLEAPTEPEGAVEAIEEDIAGATDPPLRWDLEGAAAV